MTSKHEREYEVVSEIEPAHLALVRRLCGGWLGFSREDWHDVLASDCWYVNLPWPDRPRRGPDEAFEALRRYQEGWTVKLETIHVVAAGDVVLAERMERFRKAGDSVFHGLRVMGMRELRDGKIAAWRDYFDSRQSDSFLADLPGRVVGSSG
jgi:limonene-1,2-epoxide hydrolase